jgi:hypothetical protein
MDQSEKLGLDLHCAGANPQKAEDTNTCKKWISGQFAWIIEGESYEQD